MQNFIPYYKKTSLFLFFISENLIFPTIFPQIFLFHFKCICVYFKLYWSLIFFSLPFFITRCSGKTKTKKGKKNFPAIQKQKGKTRLFTLLLFFSFSTQKMKNDVEKASFFLNFNLILSLCHFKWIIMDMTLFPPPTPDLLISPINFPVF